MSEQHFMKTLEKAYRTELPKGSYAVVRVDGKGFSKYTKKLEQPFDAQFTKDMRATTLYLAQNIDGAVLAYTQSDEISVVFSDLAGENTEWWFGGGIQKITSIVAAMATAKFNELRPFDGLALFDARVHHLDEAGQAGVFEYINWRQSDAIKNSVSMLASHHFSHRELDGVSTYGRILKLKEAGVHWDELSDAVRQGSWVKREPREKTVTFTKRGGVEETITVQRKEWVVEDAPRFDAADTLEEWGL